MNELYYRVTYNKVGIYEALKNKIFDDDDNFSKDDWEKFIDSSNVNWLNKPNISMENSISYFTELGFRLFMDKTYPMFVKWLDEKNINIEKINLDFKSFNLVYNDDYQIVIKKRSVNNKMIKNIIFDIGNVILNFDLSNVLPAFTSDKDEQRFILDNIINSPEWLGNSLIDTGYVSKETAIEIVKDRTNHINDKLVENFWNNYNEYAVIDERVLELIKKLKNNNYKIYLLSNINPYTHEFVKKSGLFDIVDGYVLSYVEHQIKPYVSIYNTLINRYSLNPNESLFIDDKYDNVETANKLGILGKNVEADNYESIIELLNNYNINFKNIVDDIL